MKTNYIKQNNIHFVSEVQTQNNNYKTGELIYLLSFCVLKPINRKKKTLCLSCLVLKISKSKNTTILVNVGYFEPCKKKKIEVIVFYWNFKRAVAPHAKRR